MYIIDKNSSSLCYYPSLPQFTLVLEDAALTEHVRSLPRFLRKFTVGSVLAYALTKCVDLLEKRRNYEGATALLRTLLAQA